MILVSLSQEVIYISQKDPIFQQLVLLSCLSSLLFSVSWFYLPFCPFLEVFAKRVYGFWCSWLLKGVYFAGSICACNFLLCPSWFCLIKVSGKEGFQEFNFFQFLGLLGLFFKIFDSEYPRRWWWFMGSTTVEVGAKVKRSATAGKPSFISSTPVSNHT